MEDFAASTAARPATKERPDGPADPDGVYWLRTHGGFGDLSWLYSKLCHLPLPLFIDVCDEAPHRPRRSGVFLDTLPRVAGWRYAPDSFAPYGRQWVSPGDPAACEGRTWASLNVRPGELFRIECNYVLEQGVPLHRWLPDLPTDYHYAFDRDYLASNFDVPDGAAVVHVTSWPDIPDGTWLQLMRRLGAAIPTYFMTASYDRRVARLMPEARDIPGVQLAVDLPWPDAFRLLERSGVVIGHTSGMTVLANVLRRPGVSYTPANVAKLNGAWADPDFKAQRHVATVPDFRAAVRDVVAGMPGIRVANFYDRPAAVLGSARANGRVMLLGDAVAANATAVVAALRRGNVTPSLVFVAASSPLDDVRARLQAALPDAVLCFHQLGVEPLGGEGRLLARIGAVRRFGIVLADVDLPAECDTLLRRLCRTLDVGGVMLRLRADGTATLARADLWSGAA